MRHRSITRLLLAAALILTALLAPSAAAARTTPDVTGEVKALIETYGPVIVLDPQESYVMDKPEAVLDASQLEWGLVDPATAEVTDLHERPTSAGTLLNDEAIALQDPHASDPNFHYWLAIDSSVWAGHQARAKAYVVVLPRGDNQLDIQFWFFYAYNGPIKVASNIPLAPPSPYGSFIYLAQNVGRHEGDWEHVTLRFSRSGDTSPWALDEAFLSQHTTGEWVTPGQLEFSPSTHHPVIYSALDSHANFATAGEHLGQLLVSQPLAPGVTLTLHQADLTGDGTTFAAYQPGNYRIVASDLAGVKVPTAPDWLSYDGLWGPYELHEETGTITLLTPAPLPLPLSMFGKFVDNGPVGPLQHTGD